MSNAPKIRRIEPEPEYMAVRDRAPETLMRRMEALAKEASSPLAGFPVGRMKMRGEFGGKDAQARFEACNWFFGLHQRYQKIVGSKTVSAQSFAPGVKAAPPDPDSDKGKRLSRAESRIEREYKSARLAGLAAGAENYACFIAVVIEEQEPDWRVKTAVVAVADALRRHRQLSSRQRQGRRS